QNRDELNQIEWIVVAIIVVIAGTYGDLVESHFKRSMQIKDSGSAIPGHGGFLDRFDSFLLAVPFVAVFLKLF
ncbi:MAG: phosphatidate cytidylyltransferase, partial [Bacteroidota bacterium]